MKKLFVLAVLGSAALILGGCADKSEVMTTEQQPSALGDTTPSNTDGGATGIPATGGQPARLNSGTPQGGLPPGR